MSLSSSDFVLSWLVAIFEKRATRCRLLLEDEAGCLGQSSSSWHGVAPSLRLAGV